MATQVSSTLFTSMISAFDDNVLTTISNGSTQMIALISPLLMTCFSIYIMLITWGYWRGLTDEPIQDFLYRMVGGIVILTLGMNIQYYSDYVVPFFNGMGDDIARAVTGNTNTVSSLDSLASAYINTCADIYRSAHGLQTIVAVWTITIVVIFGTPFLAIAAAYILLAKFALGILLALGPMFISLALFPATREYFSRWVSQCMNYVFLVCLFAAAGALECNFAATLMPTDGTYDIERIIEVEIMGIAFVLISLNLPGLASQLAGGVGISSMTGKLRNLLPRPGKSSGGSGSKSGGSVSNKS